MQEPNITVERLLSSGYREYPVTIEKCLRAYQKAIRQSDGARKYFVNFRLWDVGERESFDAELCCKTDTGGYLWATIEEKSIEATERRADALWKAAGLVAYDREE